MDFAVNAKLNIGDRVRIISPVSKYKGRLGVVSRLNVGKHGYVAIYIDGTIYQPTKKDDKHHDALYVRTSLEKIGDNSMAKLDDFTLVARVKHISGYDTNKVYCFALYDPDITTGDLVVVNTFESPQICRVESVVGKEEGIKECSQIYKAVLGKLDASAYNANEEKKKAKAELRKKMDAKKKQIEALKTDEYYASLDPEYKEMLDKMKELS